MAIEQNILSVLNAQPNIRLALLFGSISRGEGRADSDLDLAVAGQRVLTSEEKIGLIEKLAQVVGRPVDLIDLQSAGGPILSQVLTTGRLIYCTDRVLYAELIKKMLFDQADMMPYRERILAERRKAWINA